MHQRLVMGVSVFATALAGVASGQTFLVNERNASTIWTWDTSGATSVFHNEQANDADFNPQQGSTHAWLAEHFNDYFARFDAGSGSGLDAQYVLGQGGRTHYHYPKHIAVYNNEIIVMSRNDGTVYRYTIDGTQLASFATGALTGQGIATDGTDLYVSIWDSGRVQSFFLRYDSSFNQIGGFINNPTGMGARNNLYDFAYDPASGNFFGLATTGEGGTGTRSDTVLEFSMGGSVLNTYTLPFEADGMGTAGDANSCPADIDGDGDADADDFFAYLDAFAAGDLGVCDIDGDQDCDADDFFGYLDLFARGC